MLKFAQLGNIPHPRQSALLCMILYPVSYAPPVGMGAGLPQLI